MKNIYYKPILYGFYTAIIYEHNTPQSIQKNPPYFLTIIVKTGKAHEQRAICLCVFYLFENFLTINATNPPFTSGLRVKGGKGARLTSFQSRERR